MEDCISVTVIAQILTFILTQYKQILIATRTKIAKMMATIIIHISIVSSSSSEGGNASTIGLTTTPTWYGLQDDHITTTHSLTTEVLDSILLSLRDTLSDSTRESVDITVRVHRVF